jgi:hypothetical protein
MILENIPNTLFENFPDKKKNSQTLRSSSPVIKEVFTNEGCADIKKEKTGKVSART